MSAKTYQWIKGEKAGNVIKGSGETIMEGNIEFMIFSDGSRCNTTLLGDYIIEIASDHPDDLVLLNEIAPVPVKRVEPKPQPKVAEPKPQPAKHTPAQTSPIDQLLLSAKKKKEKINLTIEIDVPPTDLIKVVTASFEDGEKHVREYLKSSMNDGIKDVIVNVIMQNIFGTEQKPKKKNERIQNA